MSQPTGTKPPIRRGPPLARRERYRKDDAAPRRDPPGLVVRRIAVATLVAVLDGWRTLDDAFESAITASSHAPLETRDRAFARLIVLTVLRRKGELDAVLGSFLEKPLPERRGALWEILLVGAAQLLVLGTPPHAVISLAVDHARTDKYARRFDRLTNALLRRVATDGAGRLAALDGVKLDIPSWRLVRWEEAYGAETARRIAAASLAEAPLDLTVKSDADVWAAGLGGKVLPSGSVRLAHAGRVEDLDGYQEGAWWVQDAAAALPARALGDIAGKTVADLCSAPGGKTAQLSTAGARVTAVDQSPERLERLAGNLARLKLKADLVASDVLAWEPGHEFDAVLLDAPCTSTGTIRRHPDILYMKREQDTAAASALQARLLARAARLVRPGGAIIYCTCSIEPEEGELQIARFLGEHPQFRRLPLVPGELGADPAWITAEGDLRTLPFHCPAEEPGMSGMDGFYAARIVRGG